MWEQSKAAKRRFYDGQFHTRYFAGKGIDIGGKPDPLGQYVGIFARMESVQAWDLENGDAQLMQGVANDSFDFVHSSHCLEHMRDPKQALLNWIRITRPGGFLTILVPDEDMYEQGHWPSKYNSDHKWTFTVLKQNSWSPRSLNVTDLLAEVSHLVEVERIELMRDFYREHLAGKIDQTVTPVAECAIEIILRKRPAVMQQLQNATSFRTSLEIPPQQGVPLLEKGFNSLKRCRHGWMLYNLNDTNIGSILDLYGEFSEGEVSMFMKLLRPGDTVVESGANIGSHTVSLSHIVGDGGRIYAVEPQRLQYQALCANIALNSITNTICLNEGNSDRSGEMRIPVFNPRVRQSFGSHGMEEHPGGELVRLSTIDSLALKNCRLIKIDVEGMEEKVLRGAVETINRCQPALYVENDRQENSASLVDFIRGLGYRLWWHRPLLVEENNYFGVPPSLFKDYVSLNMVCLPKAANGDVTATVRGLSEV